MVLRATAVRFTTKAAGVAVDIYTRIKTLLKVEGIRQLHKAQEDLMEFEERALEAAKVKEEEHG